MSEILEPSCSVCGDQSDGCPDCGSGFPPVDPAVLKEACEAGTEALDRRWQRVEFGNRNMRAFAAPAVRAAAPVIADAAYRQGREDGAREARELAKDRLRKLGRQYDIGSARLFTATDVLDALADKEEA